MYCKKQQKKCKKWALYEGERNTRFEKQSKEISNVAVKETKRVLFYQMPSSRKTLYLAEDLIGEVELNSDMHLRSYL